MTDSYYPGELSVAKKWDSLISVRKYNGYEIGAVYFVDSKGVTRITSVWTRENRR